MEENLFTVEEKPVLVVDDLSSARMVLSDMLKDLGFRTCLEAKNGQEALKILSDNEVQLVFCDFLMAGMNGMDFLRELKSIAPEKIPPIIFVSSIGDVESVEQALKLGARDYLVKPLSFGKLRRKVAGILGTVSANCTA
jgi:CheY-like chemotaxis protein